MNLFPATAAAPQFRRRRVWKYLPLTGCVLLLAGCKTLQLSHYVAPRVTGRVLAADTHQPLADASVRHVMPAANDSDMPVRAGQIEEDETFAIRTGKDGTFVMDSQRDLGLLSDNWWSATISFSHPGYLTLRTNYTPVTVTRYSPDGEPLVQTGDILLRPLTQARNDRSKP
jgi:hypothetical protein